MCSSSLGKAACLEAREKFVLLILYRRRGVLRICNRGGLFPVGGAEIRLCDEFSLLWRSPD